LIREHFRLFLNLILIILGFLSLQTLRRSVEGVQKRCFYGVERRLFLAQLGKRSSQQQLTAFVLDSERIKLVELCGSKHFLHRLYLQHAFFRENARPPDVLFLKGRQATYLLD